jgi:hypothetical protein
MTDQDEQYEDEPNEAGFAGDPSTPEPERTDDDAEHPFGAIDGESVAVPAGDLTEGLTEALEGLEPTDQSSADS